MLLNPVLQYSDTSTLHSSKINYLQTLFKKETMESLRYFPIGDEHRAVRQQEPPSRDIQPILAVASRGKAMLPVSRCFSQFAEQTGNQLFMRQPGEVELDDLNPCILQGFLDLGF